MSLLIKGMDMPKSCKGCNMKRDISGWYSCALGAKDGKPLNLENIYDELIYIDSRHPDCLLAEIPTPHGDLIDRQYLLNKLSGVPVERMNTLRLIKKLIENAPTIIEAEK